MNEEKEETIDVKGLMNFLVNVLAKQGISFLLLGVMAYYFQTQTIALQEKTETCNEKIIEMYREQSKENREVIRQNTEAIRNFSFYLKESMK